MLYIKGVCVVNIWDTLYAVLDALQEAKSYACIFCSIVLVGEMRQEGIMGLSTSSWKLCIAN